VTRNILDMERFYWRRLIRDFSTRSGAHAAVPFAALVPDKKLIDREVSE